MTSKMLLGNTHTHTTLSDGRESPEVMINAYKEEGYDFLILSDHKSGEQVYNYPKMDDILVIDGCEVSAGEHYIYAKAGNVELRIKNHPNRYGDSITEVENWNVYEVTEHARLQPQYFRCRGNYPVFSDDAHHLGDVGRVGILVDSEPEPESILSAINQGRFRLYAKHLIV